MSNKLTDRQLRSLKKANIRKDQRQQLKEQDAQRAQERARRRARPPRRRDWQASDDAHSIEKMSRAEPLTRPSPVAAAPEPPPEAVGTVIEIRSGDSLVMFRGQVVRAFLPPGGLAVDPASRSPLAVGDRVQLAPIGSGEARIVAVSPRRSALTRDAYDASRRDPMHKGHVLAANIDQVVVVCSPAEPPFRPRLIDRYLVAASRDSLPVVICLNKTDLGVTSEVEGWLRGYAALGVRILRTSAVSAAGIDELRACIAGNVSLFTGHSGVGKSSLLNALEPDLSLRVGTVTQTTAGLGKGRHITSSSRLVPLSLPDTFVVDTPGIRAFGIKGLDARELASHFSDIAALARPGGQASGCAYRDCLHRREPGCAVAAWARDDLFLHERLDSYRALLLELG